MSRYDLGNSEGEPDDSRVSLILGVQVTLYLLSLLLYLVRIYSRCRPVLKLWWDDYAITAAVLFNTASLAVCIGDITVGYGRHIQYTSASDIVAFGHYNFIAQPLWLWGNTFVKLSVALLLLRIRRSPVWKVSMYVCIFFLFASSIATTAMQLTECTPMKFYWERTAKGGNCINAREVQARVVGTSVVFIFSDFLFSLLPLTFIFTMSQPLREKLVLAFLMGLGIIASVCGCLKLITIRSLFETTDPTWDNVLVKVGSYAEVCLGIMAACIPCLRSMGDKTLKKLGISISTASGTRSRTVTEFQWKSGNMSLSTSSDEAKVGESKERTYNELNMTKNVRIAYDEMEKV